jgi:hypothetical protein
MPGLISDLAASQVAAPEDGRTPQHLTEGLRRGFALVLSMNEAGLSISLQMIDGLVFRKPDGRQTADRTELDE